MMSSDDGIWADYARGVKRIGKKPVVKIASPVRPAKVQKQTVEKNTAPKPQPITNLDRRAERKLRAGDIRIEARLDMHGMTQTEAHGALADFIAKQVKTGGRNLLVITGKGKAGVGVLKSNFMGWLEKLPEAARILAVRGAAIKHGGSGAFYVILRRQV